MAAQNDFDSTTEAETTGNPDGGNTGELEEDVGGQSDGKRAVNLFELDEFKKYQAATDRANAQRIADIEARFKRENEDRERLLLTKMTEQEKREYNTTKMARELEDLRRQNVQLSEAQQIALYKEQAITQLMEETGAPRSAIDDSNEANAIRTAYKWKIDNASKADEPKRRVDVGGGTVRSGTKADKYRERYQAAKNNFDALEMGAVVQEALREGITL